MGVNFDRWTVLKLVEVVFAIACLICKRVTDDEAFRLTLYLQKLSREWRLLNNVTWDRIGAAVADATYGGYIIITFALFIGRLFKEIPTRRRIMEYILLGVGAILFIVLGSLEFASLESLPENLIDNAAIIGTLTLVTAALFLLDMGGPKAKPPPKQIQIVAKTLPELRQAQIYDIEKDIIEKPDRRDVSTSSDKPKSKRDVERDKDTIIESQDTKNGHLANGKKREHRVEQNGVRQTQNGKPKHFGIYGKDVDYYKEESDTEVDEAPSSMKEYSPVWSKIRKGRTLVDYVDNSSSRTKISHSILNEQL